MLNIGLRVAGTSRHRGSSSYISFKTVTIDHTKVPSTQTNFPVLISGTYAYLKTVGNGGSVQNSNGYDIILSSTSTLDGSGILPFEVESYDATTGAINFWVKVPSVSSSVDTVIYLLYDNASISTSQASPANVWTNGFTSVLHQAGNSNDSTSNALNGTNSNIGYAPEKIGQGATFNGSSSGINQGSSSSLGEGAFLSVSGWFNQSAFNNAYNANESKSFSGTGGRTLLTKSSGKLAVYIDTTVAAGNKHINYDGTGINTLSLNTWYYLCYTFDGSTGGNTSMVGYVNGVLDGSASTAGTSTIGALGAAGAVETWGHDPAFDPRWIQGAADELRVASVARSADWFLAEFNNQNSPSTFYTVT